jgi:hypothetical protein
MPMDNRRLRPAAPKPTSGPETDPPVQLTAEGGQVLVTEGGEQLSTE